MKYKKKIILTQKKIKKVQEIKNNNLLISV